MPFLRGLVKSVGLILFAGTFLFLVNELGIDPMEYAQMETQERLRLCYIYALFSVFILWAGVGIFYLFKIIKKMEV